MNEFEKWFNEQNELIIENVDKFVGRKFLELCFLSGAKAALENQWQPIETIPLDTEVLLTGTMDNDNDWRIKVGGKLSETGEFKIFGASWSPRYWQPLPQPPKENKNE